MARQSNRVTTSARRAINKQFNGVNGAIESRCTELQARLRFALQYNKFKDFRFKRSDLKGFTSTVRGDAAVSDAVGLQG